MTSNPTDAQKLWDELVKLGIAPDENQRLTTTDFSMWYNIVNIYRVW